MPKRRQPHPEPPRKSRHAGTLLLFWPFLVFGWLTRSFAGMSRFLLRCIGYPLVAALYVLALLYLVYGMRAGHYDLARIHAMPERSIILDRTGAEIGRIHGEKRSIVPLRHVAEDFRKAILAREDERFYQHGAFDTIGILRAAVMNLRGKRQGASTITQQLVSDIFGLKRGETRGNIVRQVDRKLLEIAIAMRVESAYPKDDILEAYINQINWGRQIRGIGEAARIYFEKHPAELSLAESAMLAGIVRGPDSFNPFRSIQAATRERDTTLERMVAATVITRDQADAAKREPVAIRPEWRRAARESFAMDAIRRDLEIILEKEDIALGGLEITTTIDLRVQETAEKAVESKLREIERMPGYRHTTRERWSRNHAKERNAPDYLQGAAVVVENRTGGILAVVGGRDAAESRFNRAKDGKRQIGSIFKPFVYLSAFDAGMRPDSPISDGPIQAGEIRRGGRWRPQNSDGTFGGIEPAAQGLIRSRNTMSVRVGNHAGIPKVKQLAAMAGFSTPMPENPSSFLGSWEATPWEVASAYTIFPNDGIRYRTYLISQIKDRDGNVLYSTLPMSYPAADADSAVSVSRILNEVTTRGTASSIPRLGFDKSCGGKTGTTNDFKDAWFAGYTSSLSCAVWVGFDSPKTIISRGFGSVLSLPIWVEIMKTADRLGYKAGKLHNRDRRIAINLCRLSGKRATAGCEAAGTAFVDEVQAETAPGETDLCPIHPARAAAVDPMLAGYATVNTPPPQRAIPVQEEADIPLRALPVEE
jgi:penicillin-binding protein 1A